MNLPAVMTRLPDVHIPRQAHTLYKPDNKTGEVSESSLRCLAVRQELSYTEPADVRQGHATQLSRDGIPAAPAASVTRSPPVAKRSRQGHGGGGVRSRPGSRWGEVEPRSGTTGRLGALADLGSWVIESVWISSALPDTSHSDVKQLEAARTADRPRSERLGQEQIVLDQSGSDRDRQSSIGAARTGADRP